MDDAMLLVEVVLVVRLFAARLASPNACPIGFACEVDEELDVDLSSVRLNG